MKYIIFVLFSLLPFQLSAQLYSCKNVGISLFSGALIEDIKAVSSAGASVYDSGTGELVFSVFISTFQFDKAFMQEHFNSDYMESDKYPKAIFKGKIAEHIDLTHDGTYAVQVSGQLTVHGITRPRTVTGNVTVNNGVVSMTSAFFVNCADHHIDIPQILFYHIAENIKITVSATYNPYSNSSRQ